MLQYIGYARHTDFVRSDCTTWIPVLQVKCLELWMLDVEFSQVLWDPCLCFGQSLDMSSTKYRFPPIVVCCLGAPTVEYTTTDLQASYPPSWAPSHACQDCGKLPHDIPSLSDTISWTEYRVSAMYGLLSQSRLHSEFSINCCFVLIKLILMRINDDNDVSDNSLVPS